MDESSFVDARHARVSASYPWSVLCSTRYDAAKRDMQATRGDSQSLTYTRPIGELLEENDSARIACNSRPRSREVAIVGGLLADCRERRGEAVLANCYRVHASKGAEPSSEAN